MASYLAARHAAAATASARKGGGGGGLTGGGGMAAGMRASWRTGVFLLKACAQGGAGVRSARIALDQLRLLSCLHKLAEMEVGGGRGRDRGVGGRNASPTRLAANLEREGHAHIAAPPHSDMQLEGGGEVGKSETWSVTYPLKELQEGGRMGVVVELVLRALESSATSLRLLGASGGEEADMHVDDTGISPVA
jgi:hypothetical protein